MCGFVSGDEINLWPSWRVEDGKGKSVRATLVNWDADGITIALEREPGMWRFVPWCQVRVVRKASSQWDGPSNASSAATFAWNKAPRKPPEPLNRRLSTILG
jgi:hypothetical protein